MLVKNFMENVLELDNNAVANLFANSNALTPEEVEELKALIDAQSQGKNDA